MEEYTVALSVLDELRQSSAPINDYTMNIIINCCCHLNRVDFGFAFLGSFLKQDYKPNVSIFSTLLQGLFSASYKPNVYSYNAVMDGMVDEALHLLPELSDKGILPDVVTYSSIIHGLCSFSRWNEAKYFLLVEMVDHRVPLDVVAFNTLINMHCKEGNMRDAESLLQLMVEMDTARGEM
ncbi:hypothetical protein ACS0TY_021057 [Phlomoides rotata]